MTVFWIVAFVLGLFFILHKLSEVWTHAYEGRVKALEHFRLLDERITSLRDHVRNTEKAVFKAIDEYPRHSVDLELNPKISAIEEEIKGIHSCFLKLIKVPPKPKVKK